MSKRPLDERIDDLSGRVRQLPRQKIALFTAACSERFVGLYEEFSRKEQWGEFSAVRAALDLAWAFLCGEPVASDDLSDARQRVELMTPHADDFDSLECTLAQDACICVASAIQWCLEPGEADQAPHAVMYSLEAIRVTVCESETGFLDLGEGPKAQEFEVKLLQHPRVLKELNLQRADLDELLSAEGIDRELAERLKQRAHENRWSVEELLAPA